MLGRTISHYRVREKIGSGGMGDVYRAVDLQLDRPVALKFLNDELLHEDAAVERLHREARAIARMAHPNIATLYEIVRTPETIFLVLEFLEGESLDLRLAHGSMGLDEILRVGIGVARGLAEAHAHGIVHRDVKPANVMLSPRGDVKILDFGLARVPVANKDRACGPEATPAGTVRGDIASRAWAAGQEKTLEIADGISGTLSYMAPEQLSGAPPDPSMDVYALGVMLYRMCCGSLPFTAANRPELVAKILCDRAPRPGQFHPDLPRELERLIEDCLEKEPTHRPSSAGFVADELEALAHRHLRRSLHGTQRLAVLPFVDMSAEGDQAYFCDGITEELILGLSHVAKLDVIARTSVFRYKNSPMDIRRIGHDLGADAVLEGSVRKAGERLRITAQLIDVASGNPLWSESYDRQLRDVLAVQDEIARNIVRALEVTLQPGESMPRAYRRARDPEAYDYYLRGRQFFYLYHRRGMELALKMFGLAVEHDPDFALAYTGMTNCWSYLFLYADRRSESLQKADEASLRALELDPGLAEAHVARGQVLSLSERHDEAEQEFRRATELDPRLFDAAYLYARDCFAQGRLEEAAALFTRAQELDPRDYQSPALLAMVHDGLDQPAPALRARRCAVDLIEEHLKRHPGDVRALYMGANCLISIDEPRRALEWAELARSIEPDDPMVLYNLACIFSKAGEVDDALDCLDRAVRGGLVQRGWIVNDPDLEAVRAHPRYAEVLAWVDQAKARAAEGD